MTAPATTAPGASGTGSGTGSGSKGRRIGLWALLVVGVVVVAFLLGSPRSEGVPYDPNGTAPVGTKALVELLRQSGADVEVSDRLPGDDVDVALTFPGQVAPQDDDDLRRWAGAGHTLVVADPGSDLNPVVSRRSERGLFDSSELAVPQRDCTIRAVADAAELSFGTETSAPRLVRRFPVPEGSRYCYTAPPDAEDPGTALLLETPEGDGQIVSFGAPLMWTNGLLAEGDNSVLAVDLLAPHAGLRVQILQLPVYGERDADLVDLLSTGVRLALLQLALAIVLTAFVVGRRLGKPVLEPQPVQIPGSELVSAVGNLLQQTRSPDRSAAILRADLRNRICERLGLPRDAPAEVIASSVSARTGLDPDDVLGIVADRPCASEAELLGLAGSIDELRRQVLGGA